MSSCHHVSGHRLWRLTCTCTYIHTHMHTYIHSFINTYITVVKGTTALTAAGCSALTVAGASGAAALFYQQSVSLGLSLYIQRPLLASLGLSVRLCASLRLSGLLWASLDLSGSTSEALTGGAWLQGTTAYFHGTSWGFLHRLQGTFHIGLCYISTLDLCGHQDVG